MRDDRERLRDVMEAIERIEKYARRGKEEFENNELVQTWMVHHHNRRSDFFNVPKIQGR